MLAMCLPMLFLLSLWTKCPCSVRKNKTIKFLQAGKLICFFSIRTQHSKYKRQQRLTLVIVIKLKGAICIFRALRCLQNELHLDKTNHELQLFYGGKLQSWAVVVVFLLFVVFLLLLFVFGLCFFCVFFYS